MAGEWLKFESNLPDKPETLAITAAMGWDDPDLTVGKLMRVFRWFDQQTIDGNALGVTPALLDRVIGVSGFVQAMANQRWIVVTDAGLTLNNFDRHNGASAKSRAQTAKRVANHRAEHQSDQPLGDGNGASVTGALAREEKRREERDTGAKAPKRKSRVPEDFTPNEAGMVAAQAAGLRVDREIEQFRNHHASKGSVMVDWQAAWRTWVGMAVQFGRGGKAQDDDPYGLRKAVNA